MVKLGKYTLFEEIGQGGFGTVYRAFDTVLEVERAVKILHPALAANAEFIERFRREARFAVRMDHPNLVPVYDLGEVDGRFYLAMKYLPGGSLKDLLTKEGPLPQARAIEVARQVAAGLDHMHAQGLVHRDLKPGNILVDADGSVRVGDFGFARALTSTSSASLTTTGAMVGTPAYMAPEQFDSELGEVGPASDVYALAVIVYELLSGRTPFSGETPVLIAAHLFKPAPDLRALQPSISAPVSAALQKALSKRQGERFASAGAFAAALAEKKGPLAEAAHIPANPNAGNGNHPLEKPRTPESHSSRFGPVTIVALSLGLIATLAILLLVFQSIQSGQRAAEAQQAFIEAARKTQAFLDTATRSPTEPPVQPTMTQAPTATTAPTLTMVELTASASPALPVIRRDNLSQLKLRSTFEGLNPSSPQAWNPVFSSDNRLFAFNDGDNNLHILDLTNSTARSAFGLQGQPMAFGTDGQSLLIRNNDGYSVVNLVSNVVIKESGGHAGEVVFPQFETNPNGFPLLKYRAYCDSSGIVKVIFADQPNKRTPVIHCALQSQTNFGSQLAFSGSPNFPMLVVITGDDVIAYNLIQDTGAGWKATGEPYQPAAFSPDSRYLAINEGIFDGKTAERLAAFNLADMAVAIAFSPDGSLVVVSEQDSKAEIFSAPEGKLLATLPGFDKYMVTGIAFSPDGTWLALTSDSARLYRITP
jgi:serine/threonine protein kinase